MPIIPKKHLGDCRQILQTLQENRFQMCVTSPPYWQLRSYLPADHPNKHLEIGNEPRLEDYISNIVDVMRGVRRVLRDDGTAWLNIGDLHITNSSGSPQSGLKALTDLHSPRKKPRANHSYQDRTDIYKKGRIVPEGLKVKDLVLLPARVALALQADGWWVRAMIPWIKRNTLPESVEDRPATATEYVFLLSKAADYFYDRYAVMMPVSANSHLRMAQDVANQKGSIRANGGQREDRPIKMAGCHFVGINPKAQTRDVSGRQNSDFAAAVSGSVSARNRRNTDWFMQSFQGLLTDDNGDPVALIVNPKGTKIKHFASYPPMLVEPMIKASTSEKGCCPTCFAPWVRIVEKGQVDIEHQKACGGDTNGEYSGQAKKDYEIAGVQNASDVKRRVLAGMTEKKTVGWKPTCECGVKETIPCKVLDPFDGTGCTAEVCVKLGRDYEGCELSEEYFKVSDIRDGQGALSLT